MDYNSLLLNGEAYTNRDKDMFLAGMEYSKIEHYLESDKDTLSMQIFNENVDRITVLCNKFQRKIELFKTDDIYSYIQIF